MLKMHLVSKHYCQRGKNVQALSDVSLEIPTGDFVAIVGPSGSGKSTLLLTLGAMLSPSASQILVKKKSIYDLDPASRAALRRKKIGFVFQTFNLVPYLSALENVQLPLLLAGASEADQQERAAALLHRVGLDDRLDHKPSELSVGQQQRVALARMLANSPRVILADEPTGNLDPDTGQSILSSLEELNREGLTIILVTHNMRAADRANRVLRLVDGSVSPNGQHSSPSA